MTAADENWPAVAVNLKKARKSWAQLIRILGWECANHRVSGTFFKAVVQGVLIFGLETWVLNPRMGKELGSFQHRIVRRITGRKPRIRE